MASTVDFDDVVAELRRLGLAERLAPNSRQDSVSPGLRLHRLTRAVVRELYTDPAIVVPAVVGLLHAASPDWQDPAAWPRWSELMPHAVDVALGERAEALASEAFADVRNWLGLYQLGAGLIPGALQSFRASFELRARSLGEEHPDTLRSMGNLAESLRAQGDFAGAQALQERVLEARRRVLGEEHPDTLTSMNHLAMLLQAQGDVAGARALQERVLEARRRVLGEEHLNTLTSMGNLAVSLKDLGDVAGARALQERVLEARRRVLGEEHPDTLTSMKELAASLSAEADGAGARTLKERMLKVARRVLGKLTSG